MLKTYPSPFPNGKDRVAGGFVEIGWLGIAEILSRVDRIESLPGISVLGIWLFENVLQK